MIRKNIKTRKASRVFNSVLRWTLGKYLRAYYHIEYDNEEVRKLTGPYLILPNHTHLWDPFMVAAFVPHPIYYVTSDQYFRNFFLRILLGWVGAIPKTKFFSDRDTVKQILRIRNEGGIIGIFPEGARNWDGRTLELLYPTAKLAKSLRIPVVTVLSKGAYLSLPRWAKKGRKGNIHISYRLLLAKEEVEEMSVDQIHRRISEELRYDEYTWQRTAGIPFKGTALAEHLELLLFACPQCKEMDAMSSQGSSFFCRRCGYTLEVNEYGFFQLHQGEEAQEEQGHLYFDNAADWNEWQLNLLQEAAQSYKGIGPSEVFIEECNVSLWKGGRRADVMKKAHMGCTALYGDRLEFQSASGENFIFPLNRIQGLNVHYNDKVEFYHGDVLYRLVFEKRIVSAYKWVKAIRIMAQKKGGD